MFCQKCHKEIGNNMTCKYCGLDQCHNPFTYEESIKILRRNGISVQPRNKTTIFSTEERLSLGLYPKDDGYKMSLISKILGK